MKTKFKNARIVLPTGIYEGELLTEGERIAAISLGSMLDTPADQEMDVEGKYLSPGFIEIHSHGAGGYDFMDGKAKLPL